MAKKPLNAGGSRRLKRLVAGVPATSTFRQIRIGSSFTVETRKNWVDRIHAFSNWQRHLGEVFVKITGEMR